MKLCMLRIGFICLAGLISPVFAQFNGSSLPALPIDSTIPPTVDTINMPHSGTITDVNVDVDITHSFIGDLEIQIDYGGTTVLLVDNRGSSADDMEVTFDDDAATAITAAPTPFVGTYQPEGNLTDFDTGTATPGDWRLTITDTNAGDIGTLDEWGVAVDGTVPVELMRFSIE